MGGSVPGPVLNFVSKSALRQATAWVKKESELKPEAKFPSEFGSTQKIEQKTGANKRFALPGKLARRL